MAVGSSRSSSRVLHISHPVSNRHLFGTKKRMVWISSSYWAWPMNWKLKWKNVSPWIFPSKSTKQKTEKKRVLVTTSNVSMCLMYITYIICCFGLAGARVFREKKKHQDFHGTLHLQRSKQLTKLLSDGVHGVWWKLLLPSGWWCPLSIGKTYVSTGFWNMKN